MKSDIPGARRMFLAKDHLPLRPVQRLPVRDRRSRVRRSITREAGWRRCISRSMVTGRNPGAACSIGTISLSQTRPVDPDAAADAAARAATAFADGIEPPTVLVPSPPSPRRSRECGFDGGTSNLRLLIGDVCAGHRGDSSGELRACQSGTRLGVAGGPPRRDRADVGASLRSGYAQPTADPDSFHLIDEEPILIVAAQR